MTPADLEIAKLEDELRTTATDSSQLKSQWVAKCAELLGHQQVCLTTLSLALFHLLFAAPLAYTYVCFCFFCLSLPLSVFLSSALQFLPSAGLVM